MFKYAIIIPFAWSISAMADVVNVAPAKLDFGSQPLGVSTVQQVILSNPTKKALNISSITAGGDFAVSGQDCYSFLPAGGQCSISVQFVPTTLGTQAATLTISDDANNTPQKVKLSGTGTPAQLVSITVTPSGASIPKGLTQQFTARGTLTNHVVVDLTTTAQWNSSAPSVASVNAAGLATGLNQGTATISATSDGVTGSTVLSITAPVLTSLRVSPTNYSMGLFTTRQFTVTGTYSDSSTSDLTAAATWSSSNSDVATVNNTGLVSVAYDLGAATIRAQVPTGNGSFLAQTGTLEVAFFSGHIRMSTPRAGHAAALLNNGQVLLSGGYDASNQVLASTDISDPLGFITPGPSMNIARGLHTATPLPGGKVLIAGGVLSAELYDPISQSFTLTGDFNIGRLTHTATLLNNGQVLIVGGGTATAEMYDPSTGIFTFTGSMAVSRTGHTATLLNDGRVLIAGGSPSTMVELYDPATGLFTAAGALSTDRSYHAAARLADGKVLIIGGQSGLGYTSSVDLYDPATGTISAASPMHVARSYHTATLLNNGQVLVAGGYNAERDPSLAGTSIERFDPITGTFAGSGNMATYPTAGFRLDHTATLLQSGQVLLAGGLAGPDFPNGTAEIYQPSVPNPPGLQ